MVELFILIAIVANYVIPFEGIIKISKSEAKILDSYQHMQIKITDETEELIGGDINVSQDENGEYSTMSVLGDLDSSEKGNDKDDKDYTDLDLKDLY